MKKTVLMCTVAMITLACGTPELTSDLAQSLLDERLPPGTLAVLAVRPEGDGAAVALARMPEVEELEVEVGFTYLETGWRAGAATVLEESLPLDQLSKAVDLDRQRRTVADMLAIATANAAMRETTGRYADSLGELQAGGYLQAATVTDGWGQPFDYAGSAQTYRLRSLGSNGKVGPAAPSRWPHEPFDPDIVLQDGQFLQVPAKW